jgi:hypothetical protein
LNEAVAAVNPLDRIAFANLGGVSQRAQQRIMLYSSHKQQNNASRRFFFTSDGR